MPSIYNWLVVSNGTWLDYFFHILGISSSQLTFIFLEWDETTNQISLTIKYRDILSIFVPLKQSSKIKRLHPAKSLFNVQQDSCRKFGIYGTNSVQNAGSRSNRHLISDVFFSDIYDKSGWIIRTSLSSLTGIMVDKGNTPQMALIHRDTRWCYILQLRGLVQHINGNMITAN